MCKSCYYVGRRLSKSDACTRGLLDHAFYADVDLIALGNKDIVPVFIPPGIDVSALTQPEIQSKPYSGNNAKFDDF